MANTRINQLIDKAKRIYEYCVRGVWSDTRPDFRVKLIKTVNIVVKSFFSADIQTQACAMTYRTMLAVVPALAMIFAIGRGFGFQDLLQAELYQILPSQKSAISHALEFVDSYLNQASEGLFVGVGLAFLLYSLISLLSSMEASFNLIWNVRQGRSIWRQITDYTAMLLILPLLMICGGGLSMFLSSTLQKVFHFSFMTPIIEVCFEIGSFIFTCLFFAAVFMMIPNAKVKFKNACIAGTLTAVGFLALQWLFVTGQLYVAKYNAIYGSFSFLPLFLLWMQLVWVIIMSGALICYASQNIFLYSFSDKISDISRDYYEKVTIAITAIIAQRFVKGMPPITDQELMSAYGIPSRLVTTITSKLCEGGILSVVVIDEKHNIFGYQPAIDPSKLSINHLRIQLNRMGHHDFIPNFNALFPGVIKVIDQINSTLVLSTKDILDRKSVV